MKVMKWYAHFAPVINATFPVRSGISREGSYVGLERMKPMFATKYKLVYERNANQRSPKLSLRSANYAAV